MLQSKRFLTPNLTGFDSYLAEDEKWSLAVESDGDFGI
jgi:hypothetical protein